MVKKRKTERSEFVGTHISKELKLAIIRDAERRDLPVSRVLAEILAGHYLVVEEDESVQASA